MLVNHNRLVTDEHFSRRRHRFVIPNFFVLLLDRGVAFLGTSSQSVLFSFILYCKSTKPVRIRDMSTVQSMF